jgi:hypothetical protein
MAHRKLTTVDVERFIADTEEVVNLHSGHDFDLDIGNTAWITVGGLSVWVRAHSGTLCIEVFRHYHEGEDPIDSLYVVEQPEEDVRVLLAVDSVKGETPCSSSTE